MESLAELADAVLELRFTLGGDVLLVGVLLVVVALAVCGCAALVLIGIGTPETFAGGIEGVIDVAAHTLAGFVNRIEGALRPQKHAIGGRGEEGVQANEKSISTYSGEIQHH